VSPVDGLDAGPGLGRLVEAVDARVALPEVAAEPCLDLSNLDTVVPASAGGEVVDLLDAERGVSRRTDRFRLVTPRGNAAASSPELAGRLLPVVAGAQGRSTTGRNGLDQPLAKDRG
jgi:hypothetical protein